MEYQDKTSPAIDVRFAVPDEEELFSRCESVPNHGEGPVNVVIWTTTPWTLPANQAVALNPDLEYVVVQCVAEHGHERIVMAEALMKDAMLRWGIDDYKVIATCLGSSLEGMELQHPFYDREVPVILGGHVTTEAGTGAVHTAPGHGLEDYVAGIKYRLAVDNPVGPNGVFLPDTELFAGEHVFKANDSVIEVLKDSRPSGAHGSAETQLPALLASWHTDNFSCHLAMVYIHGEGCARLPCRRLATPNGLQTGGRHVSKACWRTVQTGVFHASVPGVCPLLCLYIRRPEPCIQKRRSYLSEVCQQVEEKGIDAWFGLDIDAFLGKEANKYEKVADTLDVWFDSGVSHACVLNQREELHWPADLYLEGSDQHRGWFQSSLLTSVAISGRAPYDSVLTHGFTVDKNGHKMSKSRGNGVEPEKVANSTGADILRLWIASSDYRGEMTYSDEVLRRTTDTYRRIRNTMRYLLGNLDGFEPGMALSAAEMLPLDRWAVQKTSALQHEIISLYDDFNFHHVYQKLHQFCVVELGGFYLDILKDRLYTMPRNSRGRLSAQTAMYHILEALVRWLTPILSFTADEIWQCAGGERESSVFLAEWYEFPEAFAAEFDDGLDLGYWTEVIDVRDAVAKELERLRAAGEIGAALEARVDLYCSDKLKAMLDNVADELRFVLITSYADVHGLDKRGDTAAATERDDLFVSAAALEHGKCVRCWHRREDVGANSNHPELCGRCVTNIGDGEDRKFA